MTEPGESDDTRPAAEPDASGAPGTDPVASQGASSDAPEPLLKGGVRRVSASDGVPAPDTGRAESSGVPPYLVQLPTFEGPLDLLLHLIQKHELDILDIPIAFITEKYVEYIRMMQELSIDIASEYLVMAATLTHIKSKMLLPAAPDGQEDAEEAEEDPRAEIVRRLLEYQKYKEAAEHLGSRWVLGRDLFSRGLDAPAVDGPAPLAPVSMFKLLDALQTVLDRVRQTQDHQIDFERISITERINQLSDVLRRRRRLSFDELFESDKTPADVIVTFLALLEMTRIRLTRIWQREPYSPIEIELAVVDDESESAEGDTLSEPAGDDLDDGARREPGFKHAASREPPRDANHPSDVVVPTEAVVLADDEEDRERRLSEASSSGRSPIDAFSSEHGEEEGDEES